MANHTPEPWVITEFGNVSTLGDECISVVAVSGFGNLHPEPGGCANTRRIVACVNACVGVSDDALDGGWEAAGLSAYAKRLEVDLAAVTAQRDELLATMRKLACLGNGDQYGNSEGNTIAQEAIAKCEVQNGK